MQQVIKLLDLMYEETKEVMVTVPQDGLPSAQAKAQAYDHLRNLLTRPSLAESQARFQQQTNIKE